ncbi:MAG TPA: DUF4271 domain-containing protein [Cyclobacteriaceae bacterium]|nr:DUF4271 domain-containing protein [Cyclobacteriaceae bacterium]
MSRSLITGAISVLLTLLIPAAWACSSGSDDKIKSLDSRWHFYDEKIRALVPYIPGVGPGEKSLVLPIRKTEFPGTRICISLPPGSILFIGGKFSGSSDSGSDRIFNIDSLFSIFPFDTLLFSVHFENSYDGSLPASILTVTGGAMKMKESGLQIITRSGYTGYREFIIIGLLIGVGFISFLMKADFKRFGHYMNIGKIFGRPETDELMERGRPLAGSDLIFVILEATLLGLFLYIILYLGKPGFSTSNFHLVRGILNWLGISLIVLVWSFLKFSLERYLAGVMQLREVIKIHFFESNRISIFSLIVFTFLSVVLLFGFGIALTVYHGILLKTLTIIAFVRFFLISIKILNYSPYKKIYIISYLCTSELVPVILGLKIILDSSLSQLL